jgi:hypothetical protein
MRCGRQEEKEATARRGGWEREGNANVGSVTATDARRCVTGCDAYLGRLARVSRAKGRVGVRFPFFPLPAPAPRPRLSSYILSDVLSLSLPFKINGLLA